MKIPTKAELQACVDILPEEERRVVQAHLDAIRRTGTGCGSGSRK
jgi:hypothetical protein